MHTEASVALYWDFENVHASVMTAQKGANWFHEIKTGRMDTRDTAVLDIGAIMAYASTLGEVVINRAYANWSFYWPYADQLSANSMDLVQLFPVGKNAKNGADIRLSLDVAEDLQAHPHIDIVVVVSGDSDFIALAQLIRRRHKRIIGLGVERSSNRYWQMACNEFKLYNTILTQYRSSEDVAEAPPATSAGQAGQATKTGPQSTEANAQAVPSASSGQAAKTRSPGDRSASAGKAPATKAAEPIAAEAKGSGNPARGPKPATKSPTRSGNRGRGSDAEDNEVAYMLADEPAAGGNASAEVVESSATTDSPSGSRGNAEPPARVDERELLVKALQNLAIREGKPWIMRVKIKPMMLRLDPAFDEGNSGYVNFTEFLESQEDVIELRPTDTDVLVRVKTSSRRSGRGQRGNSNTAAQNRNQPPSTSEAPASSLNRAAPPKPAIAEAAPRNASEDQPRDNRRPQPTPHRPENPATLAPSATVSDEPASSQVSQAESTSAPAPDAKPADRPARQARAASRARPARPSRVESPNEAAKPKVAPATPAVEAQNASPAPTPPTSTGSEGDTDTTKVEKPKRKPAVRRKPAVKRAPKAAVKPKEGGVEGEG